MRTTEEGSSGERIDAGDPLREPKTHEETSPEDDRIKEDLNISIYRHESEELYAEDADQHMEVLTEIVTPTAEVTIDDI